MKKLIALILVLTMVFTLAACGKTDTNPDTTPTDETVDTEDTTPIDEPDEPAVDADATAEPDEPEAPVDEDKPAEQKPAEQKPAEQKPAEQKPAEQKPAEQKPAEQKPAEQKPTEQKPTEQKPAEQKPATPETPAGATDASLSDIIADILDGVSDLPMVGDIELTAENFSYYTFIDAIDGAEAMASEAMIGSIAHSVVLVRLPAGSDAETVAKDIKDNANPRKWICVEAEQVTVTVRGNLVLLVMSSTATADAITANFEANY
ncbi:MAG: hypothetical protein PHS97_07595 [Oscillospiraceae bacterium]|nr:hypothetical protein [Oscillospiraceae bacterium]